MYALELGKSDASVRRKPDLHNQREGAEWAQIFKPAGYVEGIKLDLSHVVKATSHIMLLHMDGARSTRRRRAICPAGRPSC